MMTENVILNAPTDAKKVLEVEHLEIHYETPRGAVRATNDVSFYLKEKEILGLVGESGCGKTTTAMGILQMVQSPGRIVGGEVRINGNNIIGLPERELRKVRWADLALIPQGAMNSLNPVIKIKHQMADAILAHEKMDKKALKARILQLFNDVGLPERVYNMYPHELSGGMKQRVCIAMSIVLNPAVIIADEPTSALDVVVQRVVAQTILDVKDRLGVSMIMIGHDMGLQAQMVDRVAVMYAGRMVEIGPVENMFKDPYHPYTQLLIESIPSIKERKPLKVTEGLTHDLRNTPDGCIYQLRCPFSDECDCNETTEMFQVGPDHFVSCRRAAMRSTLGRGG
ncbi:MAG: ABC transporter ATP-binding protein [Anaerolineaceae bacterium]|nr:ABC transporter ATP-binding protein [Anaerolineaceae bacterium]